ncbi:hypothetical protein GCM10007859_22210 [Brevundimonas denitrificans]|uniref:YdhG-like domain-containing protein n=1 Tax=Brevundimonas denitrificans TaxID=1443434 RepID=A0ABQ6BQX2_9CAUL|nr:DUF1801 domain-containing protein [Brevundimonas denitrificans]GLS02199.1 hypothetical protein GCM10007859_22210 [Brevundimonas denitrificans]
MPKTDFRTVDDYLATRSDEERAVLLRMQDAILSAVPEAEPAISYQLPAYKADGWIFYISAFTRHYTLSCPPPFFEGFREELAPYVVSKSAVRFPKDRPVPYSLISKMAKVRARENRERAAKKTA